MADKSLRCQVGRTCWKSAPWGAKGSSTGRCHASELAPKPQEKTRRCCSCPTPRSCPKGCQGELLAAGDCWSEVLQKPLCWRDQGLADPRVPPPPPRATRRSQREEAFSSSGPPAPSPDEASHSSRRTVNIPRVQVITRKRALKGWMLGS